MLQGEFKWINDQGQSCSQSLRSGDSTEDFFDIETKCICGKLKTGNLEAVIYFSSMIVDENHLLFSLPGYVYRFELDDKFTLELIRPVPVDLPNRLPLSNAESKCWVHFFALKHNFYLATLFTSWSKVPTDVQAIKGFNVDWKFRYFVNQNQLSPALTLEDIFRDKQRFSSISSKSIVLYAHKADADVFRFDGRFLSTEGIPLVCQEAVRAALQQDSSLSNNSTRRIVTVAMNGGLALDLVSQIGWDPASFNPVSIDFCDCLNDILLLPAQEMFILSCRSFVKNRVLLSQTEAKFCSRSWYLMVEEAFAQSKYIFTSEWSPSTAFRLADLRWTDCAVLHEIEGEQVPFLLIEAALERSRPDEFHKDYSKLISTMALCCRASAFRLHLVGKDPFKARCFGLLIGGQGAQICVAAPKVRDIRNEGQVVVCITKRRDWYIDLVAGPVFFPSGNHGQINWRDQLQGNSLLDHPGIADTSLKAMYLFLKGANDYADDVTSESTGSSDSSDSSGSPGPNDSLDFCFDVFDSSAIPLAAPGTNQGTPWKTRCVDPTLPFQHPSRKHRVDQPNLVSPFTQLNLFSASELALVHEFSKLNLLCFPYLLGFDVDEPNEMVKYRFEGLVEPVDRHGHLNRNFFPCFDVRFLQDAFEFLLSASVGLHLLHSKLGYVHSYIYPRSVMYSWRDQCWKIINFGNVTKIKDFDYLNRRRCVGAPGFQAPEVRNMGVVIPESDIWSLGQTIAHIFCQRLASLDDLSVEIQNCCALICELVQLMTSKNYFDRPPLLLCIKLALSALSWPCFELLDGSEKIIEFAKELFEGDLEPLTNDECFAFLDNWKSSGKAKKEEADIETSTIATDPEDNAKHSHHVIETSASDSEILE